jgi:hypothetical protein
MPRFEVEINGENLGRAMAALNGVGIPTISSGGHAEELFQRGSPKRRFFRSAAFPILIVIVLAFLAQRLIGPGEEGGEPSYDQFLSQLERRPNTIEKVTLETEKTTIEVDQRNGDEYETGYPPNSEEFLVNTLRRQQIKMVVEGSGGSSILSLLVYVLPFILFFAFWIFLQRQMLRGNAGKAFPAHNWQPDSLKAVLDAETADEAEGRVRQHLSVEGNYEVRRAKRWG